jgi:hypothetical protein
MASRLWRYGVPLLLAGLSVLQAACTGLGSAASSGTPFTTFSASAAAPETTSENTFGLDVENSILHWPTVPLGYVRLWDAGVTWAQVEPSRGVYDFTKLDQYVQQAQQHNVKIIYTLANTPQWAAQDTTQSQDPTQPPQPQDWQDFVQTVVTRYQGRIACYEVWNEADTPSYWTGTISEMLELARIAYATIKQIDPAAFVLAPSVVSPSVGVPWVRQFLSSGGANYTDGIAFHLYYGDPRPESAVSFYQEVTSLAQQFGKPVWDTEVGWGPPDTFTDAESAAFLARTLILQWASGIRHIVWYAWDDRGPWVHLYVVQPDLQTPTLAGIAFGQVQTWLLGSTVTCAGQPDGSAQCTATAVADATKKYIVWNPSATVTFSVPSAWHVSQVRDLQGNVQTISGREVQISPSPVLLEP